MTKFLALYMAPSESIQEMMKNSTPEKQKEGMNAWMKWMAGHKDTITDQGNPIGKNMRVTQSGTSAVSNEVCGYSLLEAPSHEEAAKIFSDCPHLQMKGAYVEIGACMAM